MKTIERIRNHQDDIDSEGSWAISYGDMITLLMCFFILFFSIDRKVDKTSSFQTALLHVLSPEEHKVDRSAASSLIDLGDKNEKGINDYILKQWNGVAHKVGDKIIVEFPTISFFYSGEIQLTQAGKNTLTDFVKKYLPYAGQHVVGIRAYTDVKKVIKSGKKQRYSDNLELSALRSVATIRTLQELGIPLDRMRAGGYGELKITAEELAKNNIHNANTQTVLDLERRVVLVIEPGGKYDL